MEGRGLPRNAILWQFLWQFLGVFLLGNLADKSLIRRKPANSAFPLASSAFCGAGPAMVHSAIARLKELAVELEKGV